MTATGDELRHAIRELIHAHPHIEALPIGHSAKVERYGCANGSRFAVDQEVKGHLTIYVDRASHGFARLGDLVREAYMQADIESGTHRPNSNVVSEGCLDGCDVARVAVHDIWQLARVLHAVAGEGA